MDDLEFVQKCVKGDKQSWNQFVDKYSRLIYNYIYKVLDTKGRAFAQEHTNDIFQEIFCALIKDNYKKLRSFQARNGCSLASWLRQVTINFTIDYLRKLKPALSLEEEIGEDFTLQDVLADKAAFIPDTLSYEERLKSLKDCIAGLVRDDKYFLELLINRGLEPEELEAHLKLSRGAIDMRKSRIIQRLRDCFRGKGFALDFKG